LINDCAWTVAFSMYSAIMGHMNADVVAASSVASTVRNLCTILCFALGAGASVLLGIEIGEGKLEVVKRDARRSCLVTMAVGILTGIVLLLIRPLVFMFFSLTEQAALERGALAKVNPPLRTPKDVKAIIEGLKDGTIDAIATDHAPHSAEEKALGLTQAPSGMVGLETALAVCLSALYNTRELGLSDLLKKLTINPACILRLPTKGRLAIGGDGDLVIFDPDEEWTVDPDQFASKGRNTPFAGRRVKGKVKYTVVGGQIIYQEGA